MGIGHPGGLDMGTLPVINGLLGTLGGSHMGPQVVKWTTVGRISRARGGYQEPQAADVGASLVGLQAVRVEHRNQRPTTTNEIKRGEKSGDGAGIDDWLGRGGVGPDPSPKGRGRDHTLPLVHVQWASHQSLNGAQFLNDNPLGVDKQTCLNPLSLTVKIKN